ncbi:hypothetical protein LTR91_026819, partial [Friedmanniomyces endolithicus]
TRKRTCSASCCRRCTGRRSWMICSRRASIRSAGGRSVCRWWRVWGGRRRLLVRCS